jgi:hypothetical protein
VSTTIDLDRLGLDAGGHLLVERALAGLPPGARVTVRGRHPALGVHLRAWCRQNGHRFETADNRADDGADATVGVGGADLAGVVVRGAAVDQRWRSAGRAGRAAGPPEPRADPHWGLAARGALVEEGGPPIISDLVDRDWVWADVAPRLYSAAASSQWDPNVAVDWTARPASGQLSDEIEDAVVQLMTFLVENEQAALLVPARLLGRLHPHFREVMQLIAVQAADEARHVEVFTRRALLNRSEMGLSGAGGRASLQTLMDESDFTMASFLLSVLGEGTFLDLLRFVHTHAPDPVTASITRLALQDEARHVAFGVAHTAQAARSDASYLARLRASIERRHRTLLDTAGLNTRVFDALVVLAAGSWEPAAIARGWAAVQQLQAVMDDGRRRRLVHIGFPADEAAELSALHTRNFM